eukprot:3927118-Lingulodinium_polyedra.AAC.1
MRTCSGSGPPCRLGIPVGPALARTVASTALDTGTMAEWPTQPSGTHAGLSGGVDACGLGSGRDAGRTS